jgi:hypothetical protein
MYLIHSIRDALKRVLYLHLLEGAGLLLWDASPDKAERLAWRTSGCRLGRKIRVALTKLLPITGSYKSNNLRETCRKLPKLHPTNCILVGPVFYKICPQPDLYHQVNTEKGISSNIFFTLSVFVKSWQQACFAVSNNFVSGMPVESK